MFTDYYKLLNLSHKSSEIDIRKAYKEEAKKWHPDRNKANTTKRMQLLNEAKLILLDSEAKKKYDDEYLKFKQSTSWLGSTQTNQKTESYEYDTYDIQDEVLYKWIINAKRQTQEIVNETIELSSVGLKAGVNEMKNVMKIWFVISLIAITIFFILIS